MAAMGVTEPLQGENAECEVILVAHNSVNKVARNVGGDLEQAGGG